MSFLYHIPYFPGFVCLVLYKSKISGERLQDHWSSGYAPNFEKVGSILLSACPFVRPFVLPSVQNRIQARVLKFHIWIPHQKIAYPYFFSCLNNLPLPSYSPFKGLECNIVSRISQKL